MDAVSLSTPPVPSGRRSDQPAWKVQWLSPAVCRLAFLVLLGLGFWGHVRFLKHDCPVDLSGDEAQYWDWSRQLDLSYYSKGPLVAYLIRASCAAFGSDTMFAVRFPALLLGVATSIVTYLLTLKLFNSDRIALSVFLLYHTVPMFAAGSVLMTIDPPFYFCWALATYLAALAIFDDRKWAWPAVGLVAGIGFLAKYAMLLWFLPLALFMLSDSAARRQFRTAGLWIAICVALLCTTPVIIWNSRHGWVSVFHVTTQTGTSSAGGFRVSNVLEFIGGQVGIIGPGLFVMMMAGVLYAIDPRRAYDKSAPPRGLARLWPSAPRDSAEPKIGEIRYLMWFGVAFLAINLLASLRTKVQLNWPAPAYFTLMILMTYFLSTRMRTRRAFRPWKMWLYPAVVIGLLLTPIAHNMELLYPAIRWVNNHAPGWRKSDNRFFAWLGNRLPKTEIEGQKIDFSAKLKGWDELGAVLSKELEALGPGAFVICDEYQQTAETAFYIKGQPKTFYFGSYYKDDPKRHTQYDLWPDRTLEPPNPRIGCDAIYLGHIDRPISDLLRNFNEVKGVTVSATRVVNNQMITRDEQRAIEVPVIRNGVRVRIFRYFICKGFKGIQRPAVKTTY